jgi:micrococcal nuclease
MPLRKKSASCRRTDSSSWRIHEEIKLKLLNILFLLISLILSPIFDNSAQAETITGKVVSVADGDTITVSGTWKQVQIRLFGIDTPEKSQAFGQEAKDFTSSS